MAYNLPNQGGATADPNAGYYEAGAGIAGAALGALSAIQKNKQVNDNLKANYATVSAQETNAQRSGYQSQYVLGQQATYEQGAFINSIAGQAGTAYRTVLGQIAADNSINSSNIQNNVANTITALQVQKQNLYNQAKGQQVSVLGNALSTGSQFYSQAVNIEDSIAKSKIADSSANEAAAAKSIYDNADNNPAAVFALTQRNLPATVIQSGRLDNLIQSDYNTYIQTKQLQLDAAKAVLDTTKGLYE